MLMPAGRVIGDDGVYVSARQICEETGIDLELLEALQRALGLPRVDDPDAPVHLRADAEAAARARVFVDAGFTREQVIAAARVLAQGMAQTAEVMRQVVLEAVIEPGATELQIAKAYGELVQHVCAAARTDGRGRAAAAAPSELETEAVNVAERAAGSLPGRARGDGLFRRPCRLHPAGRGGGAGGVGEPRQPVVPSRARRRVTTRAVHQDDRRRGDVRQHRPGGVAAGRPGTGRRRGEGGPAPAAGRAGRGESGRAGRRLVRQPGEPGQSGNRGGSARERCWSPNPCATQLAMPTTWPGLSRVRGTSKASKARSGCSGPARQARDSTLTTWRRTSISRRWGCSTAWRASRDKSALS